MSMLSMGGGGVNSSLSITWCCDGRCSTTNITKYIIPTLGEACIGKASSPTALLSVPFPSNAAEVAVGD